MIGFSLLAAAAALAAAEPSGSPASEACASEDPAEILVCGRPGDRFRIDPDVLEASRAREALPPKPAVTADASPAAGCVGPQACTGNSVPLVAMALVAAKAAALAIDGEDWREALRTRQDEYRLKKQAEERRARDHGIKIGVGARR